jgi:hypothetical protein
VLPRDEGRPARRDPEEEVGRAEVAVVDPDIVGLDQREDPSQQRPLLGVAVLADR